MCGCSFFFAVNEKRAEKVFHGFWLYVIMAVDLHDGTIRFIEADGAEEEIQQYR